MRLCPSCLLQAGLAVEGPSNDKANPRQVSARQTIDSDPVAPEKSPLAGEKTKQTAEKRFFPDASSIAFPKLFGDYELLEVIARGGMGIVYKARQRSLNRTVAVKMLLSGQFAEQKFIERFRAEAEAVAQLQHPNIVAIHEIGDKEGQPYFSMDYVDGKNLAQVIADLKHDFSGFRETAQWMKSIAEAVHYAHKRGIIHRDLKPSNILIDSQNQPRITDFGLAKRLTGESDLTVTGQVLGSPNYLPPEQAAGKQAGIGSDIYSLGAILYHLLTGRPPFQAETLTMLLQQVLQTEPVPARLLNPGIPRDLETICLKCLEKETMRRYSTGQELAEELGRFLEDKPILAQPMGQTGKAWRWCRRQPIRAGLTISLALAVLMGVAGVIWQWRRAELEKTTAQANELRAFKLAYASDMKLAQFSLEENNRTRARELLDIYRPLPGSKNKPDLRAWEWRYLWGLCQSDEHTTLTQRTNAIVDLALTQNGRQLVILEQGRNVEIWDWSTRQKTGQLTNTGFTRRMALSKTGNLVATVDMETNHKTTIVLYDLKTRKRINAIPQAHSIVNIAISPDEKLMAGFDMATNAMLWHLPSGTLATNIPLSTGASNFDSRVTAFSPDGQILALGDGTPASLGTLDGIIRLYDNQGQYKSEFLPSPGEGIEVRCLAFRPDGQALAAGYGYSDAIIRLWDVKNHVLSGRLIGHHAEIKGLLFSPDGRTLYSASADQTIGVWDLEKKQMTDRLQGHTSTVTGLALSSDGKNLISSSSDGSVRMWDLIGRRRPLSHLTLPVRAGAYGAPFTADSRRLITASRTNEVMIWDVATGDLVETIPALGTNNQAVALSPDENRIAAGGYDGVVKVWERSTQRLVANFQAHSIPVLAMRFFDNGKSLISVGMVFHSVIDVQRFDATSWQKVPFAANIVDRCYGIVQSPDKQQLAVAYRSAPVRLYNYASGRLETTLSPYVTISWSPAYSQDGKMLAASANFMGYIWALPSGRELVVLKQQANGVVSVDFTPDGKRLATGGYIGAALQPAIQIWDYSIKRELIGLWSEGNFTATTQFSPDGNTLLAISWHGIVDLWHAPSWAEIEAIEKEKL